MYYFCHMKNNDWLLNIVSSFSSRALRRTIGSPTSQARPTHKAKICFTVALARKLTVAQNGEEWQALLNCPLKREKFLDQLSD
jgi:hypothetical protein